MKYLLIAGGVAVLLTGGFFSSGGRIGDAELIRLIEDLKADGLDGYGEHAELACKRGLSVGHEIERRGFVR